jgi:hypothetical protein
MKSITPYLFVGIVTLASSNAFAQTAPAPAAPQADTTTVRNEGGRRVYVASTTIEVRGEIQRPYAFSVSGRSSLGYTYFDQPIQFLQLILDAVRRAPF